MQSDDIPAQLTALNTILSVVLCIACSTLIESQTTASKVKSIKIAIKIKEEQATQCQMKEVAELKKTYFQCYRRTLHNGRS